MSYADIREYQVKGMTCQHCVQTVQQEVGGVDGVEVASVNLPEGRLTVAGTGFSDEAVRAAIDEAGYEVAP